VIESVAARLARRGWVLRTGLSPGADQAFHRGARRERGAVELYLPWPNFERDALDVSDGAEESEITVLDRPSAAARELAARFHPRWGELAPPEQDRLARDGHEILGVDMVSPAAVVLCWTPDGDLDGASLLDDGTGQALRIASRCGIPVFNLQRRDHRRRFS
jgi:hypothetical protein